MFCVVLVDLEGDVGQRLDAVGGELQRHAFGGQQAGVLLGQRVLRLGQDVQKSSRFRSVNSTRMGNRPCSSGIRSDGLEMEAPAAMNRM